MDHQFNKLDECIFDYLACNADKPVSLPKIFDDIRKDEGHRCSNLTNSYRHRQHFLTICYGLDRNYKNIKKIFRYGKLYLMFQKDRTDMNFEDSYYDNKLYEHEYWKDFTIKKLIDYMCEDSLFDDSLFHNSEDLYFTRLFDGYETLVHLLVIYNKYDQLENLLKFHNINVNCKNSRGKTPLDIAISMKNRDMVKLLMKYDKNQNDSLDELLNEYDRAEQLRNRGRTMTRRANTEIYSPHNNTFINERNRFNAIASQRRSYETNCERYTRYSMHGIQALFALYMLHKIVLFYQYLSSFF